MTMSDTSGDEGTFDLPQSYYKPLKVGVLNCKTKLEVALEICNLPYEDFIWKTSVDKISRKTLDPKPYQIVLATNCFYTMREKNNKNQVKSYLY